MSEQIEQPQRTQAMSVTEVAKRLRVTDRAVRKWISQGHFPGARRVGPNPRSPFEIPTDEVEAFERLYR